MKTSNHENEIAFHLSSLICLNNILQFSVNATCTDFVKYISIYFMFHANVSGIFKISNSDNLWLIYRNGFLYTDLAYYILTKFTIP